MRERLYTLSADLALPTLYSPWQLKQPELLSCNVKSHTLLKDTDIYLINFPPELTQWACIQKVRMNNADFKTALLQRMSSSHTVNTNKLPKVLKSRTPVPHPVPSSPLEGGLGDGGSPCVVPCLSAKSLPWGGGANHRQAEDGERPHHPREKYNTWGFHTRTDRLDRSQTNVLSLFVIAAVEPRRAVQGQRRPRPLP